MTRLEQFFAVLSVMNSRVTGVLLILALTLEAPSMASSPTDEPLKPLDSRAIRKKVEPSIVYITGRGGGVLVDKESGLIVTNAHITKKSGTVQVVFPANDAQGNIIRDKQYYKTTEKAKRDFLRNRGDIVTGRVIFENEDSDLALIRVLGDVPKRATQIDYTEEYDYEKLRDNTAVHIFGHPTDQRGLLWQWDPGHYNSVDGDTLHLDASVWYGNSGGAVTDRFGTLIGIPKTLYFNLSKADAVSIAPIKEMLGKIKNWYVFFIFNEVSSNRKARRKKVRYEIKWSKEQEWKEDTLKLGKWRAHVMEVDEYHKANPNGDHYPKIRYKVTTQAKQEAADGESAPIDDTSEKYVEYILSAAFHRFSDDITDDYSVRQGGVSRNIVSGVPNKASEGVSVNPDYDGIVYQFGLQDIGTNGEPELKLYERRNMLWIANHTEYNISYKLQWQEGVVNQKTFNLASGKIKPHYPRHPFGMPPPSPDYPRIEYPTQIEKKKHYTELTNTTSKQVFEWRIFVFSEMHSYFDIDLKEQENPSLDAQHPPHPFEVSSFERFFHFRADTSSQKIVFDIGLRPPPPPPPPPPSFWENEFFASGITNGTIIILTVVLVIIFFMRLMLMRIYLTIKPAILSRL